MALKQPDIEPIEKRLEQMLKEIAAQWDVDPNRFYKATRPIIIHAEINPKKELQFRQLFDFEEPFRYLRGEKALSLLEHYKPKELVARIGFAHELADQNSCFYGLDDWEKAIDKYIEHQSQNTKSLIETGYSKKPFKVSPWIDRHVGCTYPVKYQYDFPDSSWRTKKTFGQFGTIGDPTNYRDAPYLKFLDANAARQMDTPPIRNQVLTFRKLVLRKLLAYLTQREPEKIPVEQALKCAEDCLTQGRDFLCLETIELLNDQDILFDAFRHEMPTYGDSKAPVHAGGLLDIARVIEQLTMELALRHRSSIRARLFEFRADPPIVGLKLELKVFYQDYGSQNSRDFEPLYQNWKESIKDQKAYSEVFWANVEKIWSSYQPSHTKSEESPELIDEKKRILPESVYKPGEKLLIVDADQSVVYRGKKYTFPEKQFMAIDLLVYYHKKGVPSLRKSTIFEYVRFDESKRGDYSIPKWFKITGGDSKQFALDGLITSDQRGNCRLVVPPDLIQYLSFPGQEDQLI